MDRQGLNGHSDRARVAEHNGNRDERIDVEQRLRRGDLLQQAAHAQPRQRRPRVVWRRRRRQRRGVGSIGQDRATVGRAKRLLAREGGDDPRETDSVVRRPGGEARQLRPNGR